MTDRKKRAIFARVDSDVADALSRTAARLGTTGSKYVEQAIVRCVAQDADKVSLANEQHASEVERLAAEANKLIALSAGYDARHKAS